MPISSGGSAPGDASKPGPTTCVRASDGRAGTRRQRMPPRAAPGPWTTPGRQRIVRPALNEALPPVSRVPAGRITRVRRLMAVALALVGLTLVRPWGDGGSLRPGAEVSGRPGAERRRPVAVRRSPARAPTRAPACRTRERTVGRSACAARPDRTRRDRLRPGGLARRLDRQPRRPGPPARPPRARPRCPRGPWIPRSRGSPCRARPSSPSGYAGPPVPWTARAGSGGPMRVEAAWRIQGARCAQVVEVTARRAASVPGPGDPLLAAGVERLAPGRRDVRARARARVRRHDGPGRPATMRHDWFVGLDIRVRAGAGDGPRR